MIKRLLLLSILLAGILIFGCNGEPEELGLEETDAKFQLVHEKLDSAILSIMNGKPQEAKVKIAEIREDVSALKSELSELCPKVRESEKEECIRTYEILESCYPPVLYGFEEMADMASYASSDMAKAEQSCENVNSYLSAGTACLKKYSQDESEFKRIDCSVFNSG